MLTRSWDELPEQVRAAVVRLCGTVLGESTAPAGRNSEFSATLRVAGGEAVFVKGITTDIPGVRAHRHEATINARLPDLAPRLLWTVERAGWLLLGFEHVAGRHADLSPKSPDLPLIADAAGILATKLTPAPVDAPQLAAQWAHLAAWRRLRHDPPVDLHPWSDANLDRFVAWERLAFSAVDRASLAHTDLHSLNLLAGRELRVIDWAWSRAAAPWVDTGFLVLRLIEAGHTPAEAERWAAGVEVWAAVPDEARTAFAVAVLGIWEFLQRDNPLPHRAGLTAAARGWVRHRLG